MWVYVKNTLIGFGWISLTVFHLATGGKLIDAMVGICSILYAATCICEDWIEAFEKWVKELFGFGGPSAEDRIAKVIEILDDTYGQDCGDCDNIERAIDILKGGYYPPEQGGRS